MKNETQIERTSFTISEIAARNGCSVVTIYRAISNGQLKAIRIGQGERRGLRVTPQAELDWLRLCEIHFESELLLGAA